MKKRMQRIAAIVCCGMLCAALLNGCAKEQPSAGAENHAAEPAEQDGAGESEEQNEGNSGADDAADAADTQAVLSENSIGNFSMEDINGETYTQEMFADYDVTMINIFTTWCTPCINEIPYLEQLRNDMADQGVNVVGIILDAVDSHGDVDGGAVEKAGVLADHTGATYPFLIPDDTLLNGRLYSIEAVPETIFVDSEGSVIGESYTGSRTLEEWKAVVEEKLADVGGAAK